MDQAPRTKPSRSRIRSVPLHALAASMVAALPGCAESLPGSSSGWSELSDEQHNRHTSALALAAAARGALADGLMQELTDALQSGGPSAAINVCSDRAPTIAAEVSESQGLRIGRTSHRLRNPANAPPVWAARAVTQQTERPTAFVHEDGRIGTLTPIRLAATCLLCHGSPHQLGPGVPEALAGRYPGDRAKNFAEGDLRGWFWIEIPPPDEPNNSGSG